MAANDELCTHEKSTVKIGLTCKECVSQTHTEKGLTFIELMVVIAIMAIATSAAVFGVQQIQSASQGSAFIIGKEVLRNWSIMALSDEGAELTVQSSPSATVWTVSSLGGNPMTQTYHLPKGVTLDLNGTPITCASMDPDGFITPVTGCTTSVPSGSPEWSVSVGGDNENM